MLQQQNPVRGFLASVGMELDREIRVEFQYNPAQISDKRSVNYATLNAPGLIMPVRQYSQGGDRTISFTVRIDGLFQGLESGTVDNDHRIARDEAGSITPELNKYRAFLYPKTESWQGANGSFVPLYAEMQQFASPPACLFGFGGRVIDCIVTEINITELLFNPSLAPLRADVSVTLVEATPYGNEPTPAPGGP